MKTFILCLSLSLLGVPGAWARSLEDIMKEMSTELKAVNEAIKNGVPQLEETMAHAEKLRAATDEAKTAQPQLDRVAALDYQRLLTSVEAQTFALEITLLKADRASQDKAVADLKALMKEGHDKFKHGL